MSKKQSINSLEKARSKLQDPKNWYKDGAIKYDSNMKEIGWCMRWSIIGNMNLNRKEFDNAILALDIACLEMAKKYKIKGISAENSPTISFNEHSKVTHKMMLDSFDRAIYLVENNKSLIDLLDENNISKIRNSNHNKQNVVEEEKSESNFKKFKDIMFKTPLNCLAILSIIDIKNDLVIKKA